MKLTGDYHMHSKYSGDCKSEMEAIVETAIAKGLKEIAITDHGPGHSGYGIKRDLYPIMHEEVIILREKYPEISILLGLEANILNPAGDLDIDEGILKYCDWLNAGYHFGSQFMRDYKIHLTNFASRYVRRSYEIARKHNTEAMVNAMKRYDIKAITHPGAKGPIDIYAVAKAAAETQTMLEINNAHGHLSVEELNAAKEYDVTFIANSDAHHVKLIGNVSNSIERLKRAEIPVGRVFNLVDDGGSEI